MAEGKRLTAQDLELASSGQEPPGSSLKEARESLEREMIQKALRKHGGKIAPSAIELGVSRPTFYELMDKLGTETGVESTHLSFFAPQTVSLVCVLPVSPLFRGPLVQSDFREKKMGREIIPAQS